MEPIKFSVIIPFKYSESRLKLLLNMLNCLTKQESNNDEDIIYETFLVEQRTQDIEYPVYNISDTIQNFNHVILYSNQAFNKSWCMNVGARKSSSEHLLFIDADSLFGVDYFRIIRQSIRSISSPVNKILFCWNYIIAMPGKDNPVSRHIRPDMTRAMGGIWYCEKDFYFNTLGGMNENFFGYGGEDNDVFERATYILNRTPAYVSYPIVHQYHDWMIPSSSANTWEYTRDNPLKIITLLKYSNLGKDEQPTIIDIS